MGPYRVEKVEKSRIFITKISLVPTDISKNLPKVSIRFYPNEKTAEIAFSLGEVQSLLGVNDVQQFTGNKLVGSQQKVSFNRVLAIFYNVKDPVLSNRSLRQALSYSAPKVVGEEIAKTSLSTNSWAFTSDVNNYLSNEDGAKAALNRAKSASSAEILQKDIVLTTTPQFEQIGKQIINSWQGLGLKAVLRIESGIPQNFQALLIAQSIPADPDQYSLWHSTQTKTNLTQYSSARVDKGLEDGRKLLKEEDRKAKYVDFQRALLEDAPATFLYFPKYNVVYLKNVRDKLDKVLPLQLPK